MKSTEKWKRENLAVNYTFFTAVPTGLPGHPLLEDKRKYVTRQICSFQKKLH